MQSTELIIITKFKTIKQTNIKEMVKGKYGWPIHPMK